MLAIKVFIQTLLPEPVAPAIKTCGIFAISATTSFPATSFPSANASLDLCPWNASDEIISLKCTTSFSTFGISIPTACFPGIGASILILSAAKFSAISSAKFAILLLLHLLQALIHTLLLQDIQKHFLLSQKLQNYIMFL